MSRAALSLALAALLAAIALAPPARADGPAFVHIVRPGETLASIAQRYYGDPRRESVLVAENGLTTQGGASIVVGLRLVIPWVRYHVVQAGETWAQIATRHYGDPRRAPALMEANPQQTANNQPDQDAELLVPYPLRHISRQADTARRVAQLYYGDTREAQALMRFNSLRSRRLSRGQIVLVPLADLTLSAEGQRLVEEATGEAVTGGSLRALQMDVEEELPELRADVETGRYTEAVARGNRLLGAGRLTFHQVVTIQRQLATAYVAFGQRELAVRAFLEALSRQPDLVLDSRLTSPRVLTALEEARERLAPPQTAADQGAAEADLGEP